MLVLILLIIAEYLSSITMSELKIWPTAVDLVEGATAICAAFVSEPDSASLTVMGRPPPGDSTSEKLKTMIRLRRK